MVALLSLGTTLSLFMNRVPIASDTLRLIIVGLIVVATGIGGLACAWSVSESIVFAKRGYRVLQLGPREYWRWTVGPKRCVFEELAPQGTVHRLEFIRLVLGDGYPAPSEVRLPAENVWHEQAPAWAVHRRSEIAARIVECLGVAAAQDLEAPN